jgi:membrane fusion protein (multidrug efflux system)
LKDKKIFGIKKLVLKFNSSSTNSNDFSAQKAVAQMKAQLAKTVIRAPFSGTIDEVFVEKGQVVAPSATRINANCKS